MEKSMAPRKFDQKIAIQKRREALDKAAFEEIMSECHTTKNNILKDYAKVSLENQESSTDINKEKFGSRDLSSALKSGNQGYNSFNLPYQETPLPTLDENGFSRMASTTCRSQSKSPCRPRRAIKSESPPDRSGPIRHRSKGKDLSPYRSERSRPSTSYETAPLSTYFTPMSQLEVNSPSTWYRTKSDTSLYVDGYQESSAIDQTLNIQGSYNSALDKTDQHFSSGYLVPDSTLQNNRLSSLPNLEVLNDTATKMVSEDNRSSWSENKMALSNETPCILSDDEISRILSIPVVYITDYSCTNSKPVIFQQTTSDNHNGDDDDNNELIEEVEKNKIFSMQTLCENEEHNSIKERSVLDFENSFEYLNNGNYASCNHQTSVDPNPGLVTSSTQHQQFQYVHLNNYRSPKRENSNPPSPSIMSTNPFFGDTNGHSLMYEGGTPYNANPDSNLDQYSLPLYSYKQFPSSNEGFQTYDEHLKNQFEKFNMSASTEDELKNYPKIENEFPMSEERTPMQSSYTQLSQTINYMPEINLTENKWTIP